MNPSHHDAATKGLMKLYETIVGHRRVEGAKRAGIRVLHARVLDLSDVDALLLLQRAKTELDSRDH
jgi:ParB-like chromosome segregation protein Spo0J